MRIVLVLGLILLLVGLVLLLAPILITNLFFGGPSISSVDIEAAGAILVFIGFVVLLIEGTK